MVGHGTTAGIVSQEGSWNGPFFGVRTFGTSGPNSWNEWTRLSSRLSRFTDDYPPGVRTIGPPPPREREHHASVEERERLTRSDIPRTRERATDFDLSDPRPRLNWISKSRGCYYWTARGDEPWNTKSAYTNTIPVSTIASIPMKMKDKRYAVTNKSLGAIDS